jgi:hypothetical protein
MTRDISGQNSGQTRDTRDIRPFPTRDTRDKPARRVVPVPGWKLSRTEISPPERIKYVGTLTRLRGNQSVGLAATRTGWEQTP